MSNRNAVPSIVVQVTNLGPGEPRAVVRVIDGVQVRAEILEAQANWLKAQISEPFQRTIEQRIPIVAVGLMGLSFVQEGKATPYMLRQVENAMKKGFREWQRLKHDEEHFQANRGTLEPIIKAAYHAVAAICDDLEGVLDRLVAMGEGLELEITIQRKELQHQLDSRQCGGNAFNRRLRKLERGGPTTLRSQEIKAEAQELNVRYRSLLDLLEETRAVFTEQTGLRMDETFQFLGLQVIQIHPSEWEGRLEKLDGLRPEIRHLLLGMAAPPGIAH